MENLVKEKVEDTYAEAFDGLYTRIIVTADDAETVRKAVEDATATPSIVIGRVEGGIEKYLSEKETPDDRKGALIQFWGAFDPKKPLEDSVKRFEIELSYRIRQDILVKPFTAVFDAIQSPLGKIDMIERVGHCGDGYEWEEQRFGRQMIIVPIMAPDFQIERYVGYAKGIMGANFWFMCKTKEGMVEAGRKALKVISNVEGVVTPFDICSAGSKPETKFPWIGPTTNHVYCPSLKQKLGAESKVPNGVGYVPEIVINGVSMDAVKRAMQAGIQSMLGLKDLVWVSAGNYGGKLGRHKIWLKELF